MQDTHLNTKTSVYTAGEREGVGQREGGGWDRERERGGGGGG